ncbi:uncharacterized protein NEMAJ01_1178 [Nematocida major]|uniref:uncharacterized protein n=1 Tax=Nematocida major TaxID=1912982 RepID=UPI002007827C|nr:uncharacterized protein NEMAJ01_1178 [Nematocida major]KAH9386282.1 hypothetical protein NEMAJ01_1178 [Nematocida major]
MRVLCGAVCKREGSAGTGRIAAHICMPLSIQLFIVLFECFSIYPHAILQACVLAAEWRFCLANSLFIGQNASTSFSGAHEGSMLPYAQEKVFSFFFSVERKAWAVSMSPILYSSGCSLCFKGPKVLPRSQKACMA